VPHVARSACSRGCDAPRARCMAAWAARALASARAPQVALAGLLGGVPDESLVDSTTSTVRDARREECPGPGDEAVRRCGTTCARLGPLTAGS